MIARAITFVAKPTQQQGTSSRADTIAEAAHTEPHSTAALVTAKRVERVAQPATCFDSNLVTWHSLGRSVISFAWLVRSPRRQQTFTGSSAI